MKNVWFTADTHFGHLKIPLYARREFCLDKGELAKANAIWQDGHRNSDWSPSAESVARMDEKLIENINSCVGRDDILWHLGDFCWNKSGSAAAAARYLERINCRNVFLVAGNHDAPEMRGSFPACYEYREIKVQSKIVILSHYAHCFWNRSHYGSWMLYGHAHGSAEEWMDVNMPGRLSMDVGVDNAYRILGEYRPFSFPEISSIMKSRRGFQMDKGRFTSPKIAIR
jgi:hypothetical protein